MSLLEREAVKRVRGALIEAGLEDTVIELTDTARSAKDAATAIDCELGAIVKSLVFNIDQRFVMALVAGDHKCLEKSLPTALSLEGKVGRPKANEVKAITGFTIGGVAPIGMTACLPMVIDRSLQRFDTIYAAAGHPRCVFPIAFADLQLITEAIVSFNIAAPLDSLSVDAPGLASSKIFNEGHESRHIGATE